MRPAVFDASVAVKIFLPVAGSDAAEAAAKAHAMVAPELVLVESANAFWKYVRKGLVPLEDCLTAMRNLSGFADLRSDRAIFPDALALANRLEHPVYDCVYLALALRTQFPLVSVDRKLLSLARDRLGIETIGPF